MKTEKYYVWLEWFYYRTTLVKYVLHGLNNFDNKRIGYHYTVNMKGFWLEYDKR
jgi:hypothetical protein